LAAARPVPLVREGADVYRTGGIAVRLERAGGGAPPVLVVEVPRGGGRRKINELRAWSLAQL
jgi:hypothetical protein